MRSALLSGVPGSLTDFTAPDFTPELVAQIERASLMIARLDARISTSSMAQAWFQRASWTGFAAALSLQGHEVEEIDIFGRECDVTIPGRRLSTTIGVEQASPTSWLATLALRRDHHWREHLPFRLELAPDWAIKPRLLRVIEIVARYARADSGIEPWLAGPQLLRAMEITRTTLPCMVVGSRAMRLSPRDTKLVPRLLAEMATAAERGLERLDQLEADRVRAVHALSTVTRPGALLALVTRLPSRPVTTPRTLADELGLSISGAGKLLSRAAELGLVVEISGRRAWRTYLTPDLARSFGFITRGRGRPRRAVSLTDVLDDVLQRFDREMRAIDERLAKLGIAPAAEPDPDRDD